MFNFKAFRSAGSLLACVEFMHVKRLRPYWTRCLTAYTPSFEE
jgi:hypothetical protein